MNAKELRIGNYVKFDNHEDEYYEVSGLDISELSDESIDLDASPIPLTEEWLLKFGFKQQGNRKMWVKGRLCVVYESYLDLSNEPTPEAFYIGFKDLGNVVFHTTLKVDYVHTLQNAYFLTGEELIIK